MFYDIQYLYMHIICFNFDALAEGNTYKPQINKTYIWGSWTSINL